MVVRRGTTPTKLCQVRATEVTVDDAHPILQCYSRCVIPTLKAGSDVAPRAHSDAIPLFTVFTPTRDRAQVLERVYRSLSEQTCGDFEWLIIDNDSNDGTDELVAGWQESAPFPIRYLRQDNRGVHASWNRAAVEARGRFFLQFRSADTCVPDALERFKFQWDSIPAERQPGFVGVTALAMDEHGSLIGTRYPQDVLDSDTLETRYRFHVRGEKWGFQRTAVLREYPLPEIEGYTGYVPEGLIWARIARRFRTRYVNEVLRVYWQDQGASVSRPAMPAVNALGGLLEAEEFLRHDVAWTRHAPLAGLARAAKYTRCGFHLGRGPRAQWGALSNAPARALWLAAWPVGVLAYLADRSGRAGLVRRLRSVETA